MEGSDRWRCRACPERDIADDADLSLEGIDLLFPIGDDVLNALQKQVHFVDLSVALLQLGFQTGNDGLREYKPRRPF